jgi:hypothetical protein
VCDRKWAKLKDRFDRIGGEHIVVEKKREFAAESMEGPMNELSEIETFKAE